MVLTRFTDEKSMPRGGRVGFPQSVRWSVVERELEPRSLKLHRRVLPHSVAVRVREAPTSPRILGGMRQEAGEGALGC